MSTQKYEKVAILGPGLIGASVGLALKQRGLAHEIVGLARHPSTLEKAVSVGAIDSGTLRLEEALEGADVVVFAAPVTATIALLEQIGRLAFPLLKGKESKPLLTDVCSTKAAVVEAARRSLPAGLEFIGGHPMAGGEPSGPEYARADLFLGATWVLTPIPQSSPEALSRSEAFARALGANVILLSPELHDELVAVVSHLPHLLAVALMQEAGEIASIHPQTWQVAARGFRDMTRLAASSAAVWKDICLTNSACLLRALAAFRSRLEKVETWLQHGEGQALKELLENVRQERIKLKE